MAAADGKNKFVIVGVRRSGPTKLAMKIQWIGKHQELEENEEGMSVISCNYQGLTLRSVAAAEEKKKAFASGEDNDDVLVEVEKAFAAAEHDDVQQMVISTVPEPMAMEFHVRPQSSLSYRRHDQKEVSEGTMKKKKKVMNCAKQSIEKRLLKMARSNRKTKHSTLDTFGKGIH